MSRSTVRMNPVARKSWQSKKKQATSAPTSQTAKALATEYDQCLVKMGKALKLYRKIFWERGGRGFTHITFITVFCYNCSILLLTVINLLLCLIYKLNLITGMSVQEKTRYLCALVPSVLPVNALRPWSGPLEIRGHFPSKGVVIMKGSESALTDNVHCIYYSLKKRSN